MGVWWSRVIISFFWVGLRDHSVTVDDVAGQKVAEETGGYVGGLKAVSVGQQ